MVRGGPDPEAWGSTLGKDLWRAWDLHETSWKEGVWYRHRVGKAAIYSNGTEEPSSYGSKWHSTFGLGR